jgi:hypothetical protein
MAALGSKSVQRLSRILRGALLTYAVFQTLDCIVAMAGMADSESSLVAIQSLWAIALMVSIVVWCLWQRRVHAALSSRAMPFEFGPNAWGWFFVPILFLYKPYQAVVELYRRAADRVSTPPLLAWWWALWILGNLMTNQTASSVTGEMLSGLITAAAGVLAERVVSKLTHALSAPRASEAEAYASWITELG